MDDSQQERDVERHLQELRELLDSARGGKPPYVPYSPLGTPRRTMTIEELRAEFQRIKEIRKISTRAERKPGDEGDAAALVPV